MWNRLPLRKKVLDIAKFHYLHWATIACKGATTKRGKPMNRSDVYRILTNRVFLGEAGHKGNSYPGEHDAIITQAQLLAPE